MCRHKAMKLNKACTIFLMGFQPPSIDKYGWIVQWTRPLNAKCPFLGQFKWVILSIIRITFNDIHTIHVTFGDMETACACLCVCLCLRPHINIENGVCECVHDCRRVVAPTKQFYDIFMRWCIHFIFSLFLLSPFLRSLYQSQFQFPFPIGSFVWLVFFHFIRETKFIFVNTPRIFCYALCITRDKVRCIQRMYLPNRESEWERGERERNEPPLDAMVTTTEG